MKRLTVSIMSDVRVEPIRIKLTSTSQPVNVVLYSLLFGYQYLPAYGIMFSVRCCYRLRVKDFDLGYWLWVGVSANCFVVAYPGLVQKRQTESMLNSMEKCLAHVSCMQTFCNIT